MPGPPDPVVTTWAGPGPLALTRFAAEQGWMAIWGASWLPKVKANEEVSAVAS